MVEGDLLNLGFKRITEYDPMDLEHPEWHYYELSIGDIEMVSCANFIAEKNGFWHVRIDIYESEYIIERPKMLQDFINILESSHITYE